jgi:hypothetical protein
LEDRLAPAGLAALDFPGQLLAAWAITHPNLELRNGAVLRDLDQGLRDPDARADFAGNHPLLAALADNLHKQEVVPASPQLAPNTPLLNPPSPPATQVQTALLSMMLPPAEKLAAPSASLLVVTPPHVSPPPPLGSLSIPPLPPDLPSFTLPQPSTLRPANKAGALAFELSPFTPLGPDIVPVPVPRGLEDGLANLFGNPAPSPAPTAEGLLVPSDSQDAARIAVQQLLRDNAAALGPHAPLPVISSRPMPAPPREGTILAGTPLDPTDDAETEKNIPSALPRSIVSLFAAGVGLLLHHLQPRALPRRRSSGLLQREPSDAKPCP